jgi:hypothetical protein
VGKRLFACSFTINEVGKRLFACLIVINEVGKRLFACSFAINEVGKRLFACSVVLNEVGKRHFACSFVLNEVGKRIFACSFAINEVRKRFFACLAERKECLCRINRVRRGKREREAGTNAFAREMMSVNHDNHDNQCSIISCPYTRKDCFGQARPMTKCFNADLIAGRDQRRSLLS